jgi:MFS family permease
MDIHGRKKNLIPGLLVLGLAALLLAHISDWPTALLMVVIYGAGHGISSGVTQVYAMDLAPPQQRGAFLGTWTSFTQTGQLVAPLLIGVLADRAGFQAAYFLLAAALGCSAVLLWRYAEEPIPRGRARPHAPSTSGGAA